jgi:hypothetical protein
MVQAWVDGPIRAVPGMLDAELRAGVDLLYVPAVAFGEPDAAAAVSACFALALALLIRAEAGRRASPGAGSIAGFFALVVPFTLDAAPTCYVDIAVGSYGFAALLCADRYSRSGEARQLILSAVFLGFAANAKLHAAILVPAALAVVLLGGRVPRPRDLAVAAALVAALVAPWFVKSALTSGNPLFPFFGEWLGYGPSNAEQLAWKRNDVYYYVRVDRDPAGFFGYLASLSFGRRYHVGGLLGPLPLALAPLAIQRLPRATRVLTATLVALFGLQFVFMPALRFGAPLLPFCAVAAAVGGLRLARSGRPGAVVTGAALALAAALALPVAVRALGPRIAALDTPRAYERQVMPAQANLRDVVARGEAVVAIPRGAVSWMPKPVYNLHWSRNGELFFDGRTPPGVALALLAQRDVRSLVIDAPRGIGPRGPVGHPIVDAWLRDGRARLRSDPEPPPARRNRVWRLVDLRR